MATEENLIEKIRRMDPVAANIREKGEVEKLSALLDGAAKQSLAGLPCRLIGPLGEEITVPPSVFYVLERVVEVMAQGDAVTVVPVGQLLTTQQAASLLNISRQYLVRLLETGVIPFEKRGTHRRLRIQDVMDYKKQRSMQRSKGLDELAALSEESGGYPELD